MRKEYVTIALAYVGVIVGAGLSSGQDILQYFLSFGKLGIIGVILMGVLNVLFGRIMLTLGCYYQSNNHTDVLDQLAHPVITKIIDGTLIIASFVMGFVMVAGAGSNLKQQFGIPSWLGSLICSLLIVIVSFLDFEKITQILGIFTPMIIVVIMAVTAFTFLSGSYDFTVLDQIAKTITPAVSNIWMSVINYFALCAMTGVSMAFVLGGSIVRIGVAEKGGTLGGFLIGMIVTCTSMTLFANIDKVKDADIPMLMIMENIHPLLAFIYTLIIFALIFNTAFSLYYATARRFSGDDQKKMRIIMIVTVAVGYLCSFGGFKKLVSLMYPILGYMGILLLLVLLIGWIKERQNIIIEKFLRRKMIRLLLKKYDNDKDFTKRDQKFFRALGEASAVDTDTIKSEIKSYTKDVAEKYDDYQEYVDNHLPMENAPDLKEVIANTVQQGGENINGDPGVRRD